MQAVSGSHLVLSPVSIKSVSFVIHDEFLFITVHVERAIARLKIFKILAFVRQDLYPYINKILVILSYTVNQFG